MHQQLGIVDEFIHKGDIKKAEVVIAKILRADLLPKDRGQILIRRARTRMLSARPDDALEDLLTARSMLPDVFEEANLLELLGDCYFTRFELASVGFADRNDKTSARNVYQQILQVNPQYDNIGWIHYQLGRILATSNEITQAVEHFHQSLLSPTHVTALTAFAYERLGFIAFYEQRDLNKSIAFLNRAVDTYPAAENRRWLVQVQLLRSRVLRARGDFQLSQIAAEMAVLTANVIADKVVISEALLAIGELLAEIEGHDREVINYLQQFIQSSKKPLGVDVTWARVNEMLGNAHFNLGQFENAVSAYHSVLQYNPDYPWEVSLYYRIARCYYQQGAYTEAIQAIQNALEAAVSDEHPIDDYRVFDMLGNAHFALKRYDKAIEAYQTAIQMIPQNDENIAKIQAYYDLARELI
jgi:tetratricopeptide (TPR) repeat protein